MNKVESFSLSRFGLIILLVAISAYAILIYPRMVDNQAGSTLVFEGPVIEVKPAPLSTSISKDKVIPKASPITIPVTPPKVLYRVAPVYPQEARMHGIEGMVVVKALVSESGELLQTRIKTSSGSGILNNAAVASLNKWKFSPAVQGAGAIKSWLEIPFKFTLN